MDNPKILHVKWNIVCTLRYCSGLGLKKAKENNKAFLSKLAWELIVKKDTL